MLKITLATLRDRQAWDHYVLGHPQGIAYQLYGFSQAVETAYGFKGVYFIARQGTTIRGILPLVHLRVPGTRGSLVSLPYCDVGGPLADTAGIERKLIVHALAHAGKNRINKICIRSSSPVAGIDPDLTRHRGKARMVLYLSGGADVLFSSLKSKVRSQVRKGLGHGLHFQMGGKALLDPFYKIFSENMRDLGSPVHSCQWIARVIGEFGNRSHIGIVRLADQTPVAAGIILCHSRTMSIPWASSLRRYNFMNPNMLLYWQFLKFAASAGFSRFDFGRSTPGEGTFRFKKQWGAQPEYLHWVTFRTNASNGIITDSLEAAPTQTLSPMYPDKRGSLTGLANRVQVTNRVQEHIALGIRQMPVSISTGLGPLVRRFISL